jgi:hypothetical protein
MSDPSVDALMKLALASGRVNKINQQLRDLIAEREAIIRDAVGDAFEHQSSEDIWDALNTEEGS